MFFAVPIYWEYVTRRNFLFNIISLYIYFCVGTAFGSFFSTAMLFPLKLGLLFDLLELYKGINMHVDKRKHTNKIYLGFLKPLTILA